MKYAVGAVMIALAAAFVLTAAAGPLSAGDQKIVFGSNRAEGGRDLYVVNQDGTGEHRLTFDGDGYRERVASWSPDASRIAYAAAHDGNVDIYAINADGTNRVRITTDPARDDYPEWTSTGRIVFTRNLFSLPTSEWIVNADGTGAQQLPLQGNPSSAEPAPHGNRLVYASFNADGSYGTLHVATLGDSGNVTGDRAITSPPPDGQGDFEPHWSPNGNDIVFLRDHGGVDNDIFVVHADGSGLRRLTSTPDRVEFWATWSSDGSEVLFFDASTAKLRAISLETGTERAVATSPRAPFVDEFTDGVRDASMWHQVVDPGATLTESGGRVNLAIAGSAAPGGQYNQIDTHLGSQCSIRGDFDYQVDYELVTWPHLGGFRANLQSFFANASVGRASVAVPWAPQWNDEQVQGYSDGGGGQFQSADLRGTYRLVRQDGVVAGYVKRGEAWRPVFSGTAAGDAVFGFGLSSAGADFGHQDGAVAFDDFKLTAGELTCPSWWTDFFPDVAFP